MSEIVDIDELKEILKKHSDWLDGGGGKRANLQDADLRGANLRDANLQDADLRGANLQGANLCDVDLWGANLRDADLRGANLRDANLRGANLQGANLCDVDLWGANLQDADLRGANLRDANLQDADLRGANLQGANLIGTNALTRIYQSDLAILKCQKGKLRAFKYLDDSRSPYRNIEYKVGEIHKSEDYSDDERVLCAEGINVATLDWCLRDTNCDLSKTYIEVKFDAKDIVAIPYNTDGKFRVKKMTVIRKIPKEELEAYLKPLYSKEEMKTVININ